MVGTHTRTNPSCPREIPHGLADYLRAVRPHHWIKNLLVFVPLVAGHEIRIEPYFAAAVVFVSLSACASGGYVFNDLLDLTHDSQHRNKRNRPMAAGRVSARRMAWVGAALAASGIALAIGFSPKVGLCVAVYLLVTGVYTLWLKHRLFLDVIALALLYELRVLAGAVAVAIRPSPWLLAFSLFVFLALAIIKRQTELVELETRNDSGSFEPAGRPYMHADRLALAASGAGSSFASVVVLTLYIQSPIVAELYTRPEFLWLLCPLLIYWLGRMTVLANRGAVDDDPLVFTLRDRASWMVAAGNMAVFASAL